MKENYCKVIKMESPNVLIGQDKYQVANTIGVKERILLEKARKFIPDNDTAKLLEYKLLNNSGSASESLFGNERPASAYFTLTKDGILVIEWGKINPNGEAKLHDFLNEHVDYSQRRNEGAIVRSGHIAEVINKKDAEIMKVALLDQLASKYPVSKSMEEYLIVTTLLNNNIVPITGDGYPIRFLPGQSELDKI